MMLQHWKCWLWKLLWLAGGVSFVLALVSIYLQSLILSLDPAAWYWNALILVALSIPVKMDCHNCGVCQAPRQ